MSEHKLQTVAFDARFPNVNQTKNCWQNYYDYSKCVAAKGEDYAPCKQFFTAYNTLCPNEWPHLVPEVAAELGELPKFTRVQIEDFLEDDMPACTKFRGGLGAFVALEETDALVLDTLDPVVAFRSAKATNKAMGIDSGGGIKRLTPEAFANIVDLLLPDIAIPPADYIEEPLPSLTQGKRISKSVSRSKKWLDEFLARKKSCTAIFAPVVGSHSTELRQVCAQGLSECDGISGYSFNDVCLQVPFSEKLDLFRHSILHLDASKPRYMQGASAPDSVVRAILYGVDLFDSSYAYAVTEQGFASLYRFGGGKEGNSGPSSDENPISGRLDMFESRMFGDFSPLADGCCCYTCRNHHRSYVHHLLKTKEMLATVLLQIHNLHCYQQLFVDIRSSIEAGTFAADARLFLERYGCFAPEIDLPAATNTSIHAFDELDILSKQTFSPTTKIQRKRHVEPQNNNDYAES
ncbi:hypothetical protein IW138_003468 [Coemansia sp. RSA 986]|nr:hypothetical protein IW138_003468 [Coemansia sp. RSA 986]